MVIWGYIEAVIVSFEAWRSKNRTLNPHPNGLIWLNEGDYTKVNLRVADKLSKQKHYRNLKVNGLKSQKISAKKLKSTALNGL